MEPIFDLWPWSHFCSELASQQISPHAQGLLSFPKTKLKFFIKPDQIFENDTESSFRENVKYNHLWSFNTILLSTLC